MHADLEAGRVLARVQVPSHVVCELPIELLRVADILVALHSELTRTVFIQQVHAECDGHGKRDRARLVHFVHFVGLPTRSCTGIALAP